MPIKVLIIDDSFLVRQKMTEVLTNDPDIEVTAAVPDPVIGIQKIHEYRPDVIILDIEMAQMDGLTLLLKINESKKPIPCIIFSVLAETDADTTKRAIEYGAVKIIKKPTHGVAQFIDDERLTFYSAVKTAADNKKVISPQIQDTGTPTDHLTAPALPSSQTIYCADAVLPKPNPSNAPLQKTEKIVVVGASTGGTEALKDFLTMLPKDAPGIVIVQHMPEHFTTSFARRMNAFCKITVKEAKNGDLILPGQALIAPGNLHIIVKRNTEFYSVETIQGVPVARHRPSIDILFRSTALSAGQNAIGIIMTGMGDDGACGLKELHDSGAFTIAQDESTCIVFGMPREAINKGGVDEIVPLSQIAPTVINAAKR